MAGSRSSVRAGAGSSGRHTRPLALAALSAVVVLAAAAADAGAQTTYRITDLGALGAGDYSMGLDINYQGQVVGDANLSPGADTGSSGHAFLWDPVTGIHDLGTLGGNSITARAINDNGFVVGDADPSGSSDGRPFLWDPNTSLMHDLGTLGGDRGMASDINDNMEIVGTAKNAADEFRPFYQEFGSGPMEDMGTLFGGAGGAAGINFYGNVVGYSSYGSRTNHAVYVEDPPAGGWEDLGTISGTGEYAQGSPAEAFDLQKQYLELILGFMGITDIRKIAVEPTLMAGPDGAEQAQIKAIALARELATKF